MLKRKLSVTLAVITMIVIVQACRKFDFTTKESKTPEFTIAEAKEWYYGVFKKSEGFKKIDNSSPFVWGKLGRRLVETDTELIRKFPYWNLAKSYVRGTVNVVEMPVFYETKYIPAVGLQHLSENQQQKITEAAFNKVLLIKSRTGNISLRIVTFIPDSAYALKNNYDLSQNAIESIDNSFSGYIIVRNWDEKIINAIKINNGDYIRKVIIKKEVLINNDSYAAQNTGNPGDLCGILETPVYVTHCPLTGLTSEDAPVHELGCPPEELIDIPTGEVVTEEYPPCEDNEPEEPIDPDIINGLDMEAWNDCLNNGNSSETCLCNLLMICDIPPSENGDNPPSDNQQNIGAMLDNLWIQHGLKDSSNNPCIASAINTLTSINNKLPKLVRDFFDLNAANFTMIIKSETKSIWPGYNQAPEGARTVWNITNDTFNVHVNNYYENITDLGLAATLIHEALHCQLLSWYRKANIENNVVMQEYLATTYGYLFPDPFKGDSSLSAIVTGLIPTQHQDMINRYKSLVEAALTQFAIAKGLNVSAAYIKDIAWVGTDKSRAFLALQSFEKERIRENIGSEKDPYSQLSNPAGTITVNGIQQAPKGNPCN